MLAAMRTWPDLMKEAFVHDDSKVLTPEMVDDIFIVPESKWSPEGSNKRRTEVLVHSWFRDFIADGELQNFLVT